MRRLLTLTLAASIAFIAGPAARTPQQPTPPAPGAFTADDMLNVTTLTVLDVSDDGRFVAGVTRRGRDNAETDHRRYGDPSYVSPAAVGLQIIDTQSGAVARSLPDLTDVRQAAWSNDSRQLAILTYARPTRGRDAGTRLFVWDTARPALREIPLKGDAVIAVNSNLAWLPDDTAVVAALRQKSRDAEARKRFEALTEGPIVVHAGTDPFLEWDALNRASRERSLAAIDLATGQPRVILPERKVVSYQVARDGTFITFQEDVTEKTDYDVIGGTDSTLRLVQTSGGDPRTIAEAKDIKGLTLRWSDDGRVFAYAKKGEVFVQGIDEAKPRSLTPAAEKKTEEKPPAAPPPGPDTEDPKDEKESFSVGQFSRDGLKLLATSKKGWYVIDVKTAAREQILTLKPEEDQNPRMEAVTWSPDGRAIYLTWSERDRWERGLVSLDVATKTLTPLVKDARLYAGFRLARSGSRWIVSVSQDDRPPELYAADANLSAMRKLTDLNPWLAQKSVPRSELVSYRDTDGKVLYGVLRYPVGYEKGKTYPTIFEVYETFFDNGFNGRAAFLANHGFAVFHPSVNLIVGRPGEAWVKGVTSAANRLIEMGVADPDRLGVHGTSYGGYATVLLLTQTDRFKAAINISGKVNMVSFYTDSPRLGVRNTHAPEKSQDRVGGTLWEFPERYLEHSAVMRADRITTPLLCITGDQDPNVPASQSREIYYALRRLGKDVEWVRYVNGGHRPPNSASEAVDFESRILAWYAKYLKK